ncbi:MAG: hypothetical protein GX819_00655 [Clostridiaceae bacterium]|nr:hypothetical protein [Clostridiaceae bacterium]
MKQYRAGYPGSTGPIGQAHAVLSPKTVRKMDPHLVFGTVGAERDELPRLGEKIAGEGTAAVPNKASTICLPGYQIVVLSLNLSHTNRSTGKCLPENILVISIIYLSHTILVSTGRKSLNTGNGFMTAKPDCSFQFSLAALVLSMILGFRKLRSQAAKLFQAQAGAYPTGLICWTT